MCKLVKGPIKVPEMIDPDAMKVNPVTIIINRARIAELNDAS